MKKNAWIPVGAFGALLAIRTVEVLFLQQPNGYYIQNTALLRLLPLAVLAAALILLRFNPVGLPRSPRLSGTMLVCCSVLVLAEGVVSAGSVSELLAKLADDSYSTGYLSLLRAECVFRGLLTALCLIAAVWFMLCGAGLLRGTKRSPPAALSAAVCLWFSVLVIVQYLKDPVNSYNAYALGNMLTLLLTAICYVRALASFHAQDYSFPSSLALCCAAFAGGIELPTVIWLLAKGESYEKVLFPLFLLILSASAPLLGCAAPSKKDA